MNCWSIFCQIFFIFFFFVIDNSAVEYYISDFIYRSVIGSVMIITFCFLTQSCHIIIVQKITIRKKRNSVFLVCVSMFSFCFCLERSLLSTKLYHHHMPPTQKQNQDHMVILFTHWRYHKHVTRQFTKKPFHSLKKKKNNTTVIV